MLTFIGYNKYILKMLQLFGYKSHISVWTWAFRLIKIIFLMLAFVDYVHTRGLSVGIRKERLLRALFPSACQVLLLFNLRIHNVNWANLSLDSLQSYVTHFGVTTKIIFILSIFINITTWTITVETDGERHS